MPAFMSFSKAHRTQIHSMDEINEPKWFSAHGSGPALAFRSLPLPSADKGAVGAFRALDDSSFAISQCLHAVIHGDAALTALSLCASLQL